MRFGSRYPLGVVGVVLASCPGEVSTNGLEPALQVQIAASISRIQNGAEHLWLFIDSDCNGMMTREEAMEAASKISGVDHEHVYGNWTSECWHNRNHPRVAIHFLLHMLSEFFRASGNVWWTACGLARTAEVARIYDARLVMPEGDLTHSEFLGILKVWFQSLAYFEQHYFVRADHDKDGCLSEHEYYRRVMWFICHWWPGLTWHPSEYPDSCRNTAPDFMDILTVMSPDDTVYLNYSADNPSCVDAMWWSIWALQSASESFPLVKEVAQCYSEEQHDALSGKDRLLLVVLVLSFGICTSGCVALGLILRYYRRKGRTLREARSANNLLKAKIDTWSLFDVNLKCKVADLSTSFKHYFGLHDPELVEISLIELVHPEDSSPLQSSLQEVKDNHASSMPVLAVVRFIYGATARVREESDIQYLPVELLMLLTSESSVLVGVTTSATVQTAVTVDPQVIGASQAAEKARELHDAATGDEDASTQEGRIQEGANVSISGDSNSVSNSTEAQKHDSNAQRRPLPGLLKL